LYDFLQSLETLFKFGQREFAPFLYCNAAIGGRCPMIYRFPAVEGLIRLRIGTMA
jgi:hypothetical protein